ncbi:MAG: penicillin acylase family protein, partial [Deltaproteobacteria bacterium]|nr:penicillin acylase family protein [Deltaproteobacteria bacterium]
DVFEQMGYAVATDRLWQAEKYRRLGRGRLAEVFGPSQLASDIKVRTTGYSLQEYKDGFAALNQESQDAVNGYVAGFNRRIAEIRKDSTLLPFEFKLAGFFPEDWSSVDVLAWATALLRFFDGEATGQGQINNYALYQTLAAKYPADFQMMFQDLRWMDDPDAVTYIEDDVQLASSEKKKEINTATLKKPLKTPAGKKMASNSANFKKIADDMRQEQETIIANLKKINAYVKMGSYAWVVSGDKTASGNPIIYSGPQMDHAFKFSVPSIVAEGSIQAGGLNISGMVIPGLPAIVIGRSLHHAWSMQVGHAHTLDYFLEDPSAMKLHRVEIIKVAGQDDVKLPVFRTDHGPIVNADPYISWSYANWGHEFEVVGTYLDFARAQSMDEFGSAIRKVSLSQHYCYADRDGNIAYWMSGYDPVRVPGADPRFPQMGDGSADWPTPVTYKPLATDRNAARGFYSGWNSRASSTYSNAPNNPSYYFGPFHRAHVIEDYLASHDKLTFADIRDLALYIATTDSIRN